MASEQFLMPKPEGHMGHKVLHGSSWVGGTEQAQPDRRDNSGLLAEALINFNLEFLWKMRFQRVSHGHVKEVLHQLRVPDCDTAGLSISLTSSSSFSWYLVVALTLESCVAVVWYNW